LNVDYTVGLPAQTGPALCCATPLGLMFWLLGTQGRRSCLAPTLGFVVERRWRSIPVVFNARQHRHHECRWRSIFTPAVTSGDASQHRHRERRWRSMPAWCSMPLVPNTGGVQCLLAPVSRTPTAFHNKGQDCRRKAATLSRPKKHHNPTGVAYVGALGITPVCWGICATPLGSGINQTIEQGSVQSIFNSRISFFLESS
jgi:hypothetical protein